MIIVKNFGAKIWLFAMFWYETLSGFQHAVSSNAHNMNYGLLMTNVPLLHMMQEGFFDFQKKTQHFFSGSYWRCHRSHWHQSELFLEMSYLVQASGALRIYTLVDLKALEDERKKFDKRKIHGLLQEESDCMKITKKVSLKTIFQSPIFQLCIWTLARKTHS